MALDSRFGVALGLTLGRLGLWRVAAVAASAAVISVQPLKFSRCRASAGKLPCQCKSILIIACQNMAW